MAQMHVQELIEMAVKEGVSAGVEAYKKQEKESMKNRHDRRLRNTDLLLRNYTSFKVHCAAAVYSEEQLEREKAIDILDEANDMDGELFVSSIRKTKLRTAIIMMHIERVMRYYNAITRQDDPEQRKYQVLQLYYIKKMKYDDIAEQLHCSRKTVERAKRDAVYDLSILLFGIDGLKL